VYFLNINLYLFAHTPVVLFGFKDSVSPCYLSSDILKTAVFYLFTLYFYLIFGPLPFFLFTLIAMLVIQFKLILLERARADLC